MKVCACIGEDRQRTQSRYGNGQYKRINHLLCARPCARCADCRDGQDLPLGAPSPGEEKRESEMMVVLTGKARRDGDTAVKGKRSSWKGEVSVHGWKGGARALSRPRMSRSSWCKAGRKKLGGGGGAAGLTPGLGRGSHQHSPKRLLTNGFTDIS